MVHVRPGRRVFRKKECALIAIADIFFTIPLTSSRNWFRNRLLFTHLFLAILFRAGARHTYARRAATTHTDAPAEAHLFLHRFRLNVARAHIGCIECRCAIVKSIKCLFIERSLDKNIRRCGCIRRLRFFYHSALFLFGRLQRQRSARL